MKAFSSMKRYLKLSSKVLEKLEIKIVLFILRYSNCTGFQIQRLSLRRQKGESQNGCYGKESMPNFPKNGHFLPPDKQMCVSVSEGKKIFISRKI